MRKGFEVRLIYANKMMENLLVKMLNYRLMVIVVKEALSSACGSDER